MKPVPASCIALLLLPVLWCPPAHAADAGACTSNHAFPDTTVNDEDELSAHRQFALPAITYPSDATPGKFYELSLTVHVDAAGKVVCYGANWWETNHLYPNDINPSERAALAQVGHWHYTPFRKDGQPVAVTVHETIYEQRLPDRHLPLPAAALEDFSITLERSRCFNASCPVYKVEIGGDGRVVYRGEKFVDVEGEHAYRVPTQDVARLLESVRSGDLWSMRPEYDEGSGGLQLIPPKSKYDGGILIDPAYRLTIAVGSQKHIILDQSGEMVDMPRSVHDVEKQVDAVAQTGMWIHLTMAGIEHLQTEHFDFHSREGAELLERASSTSFDRVPDRQVLARLAQLGAGTTH